MKEFLFALQFLTIIPVKVKKMDENKFAASLIYFPLIGCFLGALLAGVRLLASFLNLTTTSTSIIMIILLIFLTGGIHLDGLADTTDAILSRKNKEEMLGIMRDPHIGTMGALSVISILLLKIAFLVSIDVSLQTRALLLMCILSRWSLVLSLYFFPYARKEGKARLFKEKINLKIYLLATLITLVAVTELLKFKGLLIFTVVGGAAFLLGRFFQKHLGGITGDTLGAINEVSEVIVLLCFCIFGLAS